MPWFGWTSRVLSRGPPHLMRCGAWRTGQAAVVIVARGHSAPLCPPAGGHVSSVMSSPVARLAFFESIGRTCPAAQYRAQGKVLPRGAGHRGNKGDATETVVNAKILFSVRDLWIARLPPATHPARGASGNHFGAGPEQNRRPCVATLEREQMGPARGVPIEGSSRCADPPHHWT